MKDSLIKEAAAQYGNGLAKIEVINEGLIHNTYKLSFKENPPVLLQHINTTVFQQPEKIIQNYCLLQEHFSRSSTFKIPALLTTKSGQYFWTDTEQNFWRASEFVENSYSLSIVENAAQAFAVANCFGRFTKSLEGFDIQKLNIVILHFHDVSFRYGQFEESLLKATSERLLIAKEIISELRQRKKLLNFYQQLDDHNYPLRIMHHDCKISNVLFDANSKAIICAVDMDTVMPGRFFSDVGDMVRTMACSVNENNTNWQSITIRKDFYKSIIKGYLEGIENSFTLQETEHIHYAGLLMTYMQSLRFLTDFLNNDVYYQTSYENQNFDRAKNQLLLLKGLEVFLKEEYRYND
jgi:Ser/Thr protein kinase RdoA (MazF antagonist)